MSDTEVWFCFLAVIALGSVVATVVASVRHARGKK